ncbi:LppP/LprE family lipoprotein [Antricoccus suffuscus]|nr:LppP/LprE family lipoprotein [Antricoccus suffuscus]
MTPQQAAQTAAEKLPRPFSDPTMSYVKWDPSTATTDGYNPCATLGWIVMPIEGGTASSPYAIALFHMGKYIGRATAKSYGFFPTVTRVDDATISVTYHWPRQNETNAEASGTSLAQFHFDTASGTVKMTGNAPAN